MQEVDFLAINSIGLTVRKIFISKVLDFDKSSKSITVKQDGRLVLGTVDLASLEMPNDSLPEVEVCSKSFWANLVSL